jgi:hypothetical protein
MGGRTGLPGGTARGPPGHERSPGTLSPEALRLLAKLLPGAEASPGVSPSPGKIIYPRTAMPTRSILPGSGTILGFSLPGAAEAKHRRVIICYPEALILPRHRSLCTHVFTHHILPGGAIIAIIPGSSIRPEKHSPDKSPV